MKKLLLILCALLGTVGAWATVTSPTLTTNVNEPHYYTIKNYRSGKYAAYAGASTQLAQISDFSCTALWYFVENSDGVFIVPAVDPSVKLVSNSSANATGSKWYLVENPHQTGYFCVSLSSTAASQCWDDNGTHTGVGYWQPSANDHEGTSWTIEESSTTLAEVIGYRRDQILPTINALPEVLRPSAKMAALNSAATDADFRAAVADFSANVTFLCRSGKYLEIGETQGIISSTDKTNNAIIQLESVGDGSFYLKGYMSMKYMGDVEMSAAIQTESSANIPYYIQTVTVDDVKYAVARPTKYADSGYHYIHNGGSGCVGWSSNGTNTQFTIEEASLPVGFAAVTYNIELDDAVIVSETVRQATGSSSVVPSKYANDYTTYAYDVTTIPDASSATITATATVSDLPFKVSTSYEGATWYYMQLHTTWANNVSTNDDAILWESGSSSSDKYYWAFMGNPIQGIKVINRATGDSKYLSKTDPATMTTTPTVWALKKQDATHFGLYDEGRSKYANGQSSTLKYWWYFDAGSQFWVTEVAEDEIEFVDAIANLEAINWSDADNAGQLNRYNFTGSYVAGAGSERSIIASLKSDGYSAENLTMAQGMLDNYALNMPAAGFYRLKGKTSSKYLAAGLASNSKFNMTDAEDATTIFYFDGSKLINYGSGMCNGMTKDSWAWVYGESASTVSFQDGLSNGGYGIKSATCNFYDNGDKTSSSDRGNNVTINSSTDERYTNWQLTQITTLPISISAAEYATFYSPVALTIPTGVTAYTGVVNGNYLTLTALSEKIPANTAVILAGDEGSYNFDVTTADAFTGDNALLGSVGGVADVASNILTLQNDGQVGFYTYTGENLNGFKAYLNKPASVKALTFQFGTPTGVNAISTVDTNKTIFNIAGQRVQSATKGIYIVGGKKVVLK
jgi:hypothetical protein